MAGRQLTYETKDAIEQYSGTPVAPISRDVLWKKACKENCDVCHWNKYEVTNRREYFRNETINRKSNHAIDTWKGRIQRELLDLSEAS